MLGKYRLNFYRLLSAVLFALLLVLSGVTYVNAHGGDTSLIHACVNKLNRSVKIVSATTNCPLGYFALHWSIKGPKGDTGATGLMGPQGPQGEPGTVGLQGPQGDIGPAGPQGIQGDTGPAGPQGLTGPQGIQGETGPMGPQGPAGFITLYKRYGNFSVAPTVSGSGVASCDPGDEIISGGYGVMSPIVVVTSSTPVYNTSTTVWSWSVVVFNNGGSSTVVYITAVCGDTTP
jgi:hypothetical protein